VAFLDADDTGYPFKSERQLRLFESACGPVVVGAQMHYVGARGSPIGISGLGEVDDEAQRLVRRAELMPFAMSSALVDRTAFQAVGGFDEALQRDVPGQVEDLDFIARIAAHGPIRTVGEPLGAYRVHPGSVSARQYRSQREGARYLVARLVAREAGGELAWQEFLATRDRPKRDWLDDTARSLYRAAGVLAGGGRYFGAACRFCASFVLRPLYATRRIRQQRVLAHLRPGRSRRRQP
jgi:GT2 family glycosyltransferase